MIRIQKNKNENSIQTTALVVISTQRFKFKAKSKLNDILLNNVYQLIGFEVLERFLRKFHVLIAPTFADYVNGVKPFKRRRISYAINILDWIMVFRFALLFYINKPWIWTLFGDTFYIWGNSNYLFAVFLCFGCAIATINNSYLIFEENHSLKQ